MNIIWENKGIILGIISYLIEYREQFKNNIIIIQNTKFNTIISNLFPDIKIMDSGSGFKINIKNQKNHGLIINNLQNLSTINAKKVRVLPWFDKDNPIVMYVHTKKKIYDKNLFEDDLNIFNKDIRFNPRQPIEPLYAEFIGQHCGLNIWDTYTEYDILLSYVQYYPNNIFEINQYIDNELGGLRCEKPVFISVPIKVPVKIPVNVPIKVPVEVPVKIPIKESYQYNNINKSIDIITDIIRRINKILENRLI